VTQRISRPTFFGVEIQPEGYVQVVAMDAQSAIAFFGFDPSKARALDAGPADSARWRTGAHVWHVYADAKDLPS
jgi:hypothetical protein